MKSNFKLLSGNALKIIAAISMLIDHMGHFLFPWVAAFRIIGRLAFPIFAFMIAQGCKYTRNRLRYFLTVFCVGMVCQAVNWVLHVEEYLCILLTFSISILLIYMLQLAKETLSSEESKGTRKALVSLATVGAFVSTFVFVLLVPTDYGFAGVLTPVFASVFAWRKEQFPPEQYVRFDNNTVHTLMMVPPLLIIALEIDLYIQYFSFLAIPLLLMYSGKRGRLPLKYLFYVFYPLHLAVLGVISFVI